ncbi:hypothetical protein KP509_29G034500 [Ceratopteris richardii]|uniref:Uncharacterized protein n=1 Tax=Ceratopteris richardii TaxID=49495 RepID=A0A8T2R864_CERRI|nr:hypothetical protein KP509_29G034500 [Ceratopteris richardii]
MRDFLFLLCRSLTPSPYPFCVTTSSGIKAKSKPFVQELISLNKLNFKTLVLHVTVTGSKNWLHASSSRDHDSPVLTLYSRTQLVARILALTGLSAFGCRLSKLRVYKALKISMEATSRSRMTRDDTVPYCCRELSSLSALLPSAPAKMLANSSKTSQSDNMVDNSSAKCVRARADNFMRY